MLVQRASEWLQTQVLSGWGMTENGLVTAIRPDDPPEKANETDGKAIPEMEVQIVDDEGRPAEPAEEGRLQVRGIANFVGYLEKPGLYDHDEDGWFETGDLARPDAEGYLRISDRSKDLIIRGGENIPVVEVEQLLYKHPAVQDVAIVSMPDKRLGERSCAFAVLRPGRCVKLPELAAYLEQVQMARQYFPERLEIVEEMPRTASGKIQKSRLRRIARGFAA